MEAENGDALWNQAEDLLRHHQKSSDATPLDALNRLFHEAAPKAKAIRLSNANCRIASESWSTEKLSGLYRRHDRANPKDEACPILLVRWRSNHYLIDGANRINKWLKENKEGEHAVLVIVVADKAD
jgi:hypothetical protein